MTHDLLSAHLQGELLAVCQEPNGSFRIGSPAPSVLFPGSFNPLHAAHRELAEVAARCLGQPVAFELSANNVDKGTLEEAEIRRRLLQFAGYAPVWVTRAAAFQKKADVFPNCAFVLGYDTAIRLIDPRYYAGVEAQRDGCLRKLLERGCRVLVGGRIAGGRFQVWDSECVAAEFRELFLPLSEADFRHDLSSTELRESLEWGPGG
jgi:Cytidylyltransferase-like